MSQGVKDGIGFSLLTSAVDAALSAPKNVGDFINRTATDVAKSIPGIIAGSAITAHLTADGSVAPGIGNAIGFLSGTLITAGIDYADAKTNGAITNFIGNITQSVVNAVTGPFTFDSSLNIPQQWGANFAYNFLTNNYSNSINGGKKEI